MFGNYVGYIATWLSKTIGLMSDQAWEGLLVNLMIALPLVLTLGGSWRLLVLWQAPYRAPKAAGNKLNLLIADLVSDPGDRWRKVLCKALAEWAAKENVPIVVYPLRRSLEYRSFLGDAEGRRVANQIQLWLAATNFDVLIWGEWLEALGASPSFNLRFGVRIPRYQIARQSEVGPLGSYSLKKLTLLAALPKGIANSIGTVTAQATLRYLEFTLHEPGDPDGEILERALEKCWAILTSAKALRSDFVDEIGNAFYAAINSERVIAHPETWRERVRSWIQKRLESSDSADDRIGWEWNLLKLELLGPYAELNPVVQLNPMAKVEEALKSGQLSATPDRETLARSAVAICSIRRGNVSGDRSIVETGIQLCHNVLPALIDPALKEAKYSVSVELAEALTWLGDMYGDKSKLEEALALYRAVLDGVDRGRQPLQWAKMQSAASDILRILGIRFGSKSDLEDAISGYRLALLEQTFERTPYGWTLAMNNLGGALNELGGTHGDLSAIEKAIAVYREASSATPRKSFARRWASTQDHLGNALLTYGESRPDIQSVKDAIVAYGAALSEHSSADLTDSWAAAQGNLSNALATLGAMTGNVVYLEAALGACCNALEMRPRQKMPMLWAMTMLNLGTVYLALGKATRSREYLEKAIDSLTEALKEYTPDRAPLSVERVTSSLASANAALERLGPDISVNSSISRSE